jgi:hypothetical protein
MGLVRCITFPPPFLYVLYHNFYCIFSCYLPLTELPYDSRFIANQFAMATSPFRLRTSIFFSTEHLRSYSLCNILSVCRLQLLLVFASTVILRSKSHGTCDHILLSQIRHSPNQEDQVPIFISPRNKVAQLYPQALCSLFIASYDSQGYGGGIHPCLHLGVTLTKPGLRYLYN